MVGTIFSRDRQTFYLYWSTDRYRQPCHIFTAPQGFRCKRSGVDDQRLVVTIDESPKLEWSMTERWLGRHFNEMIIQKRVIQPSNYYSAQQEYWSVAGFLSSSQVVWIRSVIASSGRPPSAIFGACIPFALSSLSIWSIHTLGPLVAASGS